MGLLDSVREVRDSERAYPVDTWIQDYLIPATQQFAYNGQIYQAGGNLIQTMPGQPRVKEITLSLPAYTSALMRCPPAFAAQLLRALVLSQARFTFRNLPSASTPRRTFGTQALQVLEQPWPNATTGLLISKMEWHAGLAGNSYVYRQSDRLRVLRPDWVGILFGSQQDPDEAAHALDGEIVGYIYQVGGINSQSGGKMYTLLPADVVHWAPIPDPLGAELGMSWVTAALRDMQADNAATEHKLNFFRNGATPNMVVKNIPATNQEQFDKAVDMLEAKHSGVRNAYRTLYLTGGADVSVVGSDLHQLDFKQTQGAGETRISVNSRVPAPILGIAEGLAGSSLNAGNFGMSRRLWADTWIYPTLQDICRSLSWIVRVPRDAELWYDVTDMPILREDAKDAAAIQQTLSATIVALVNGGFIPESVLAAVTGQNLSLLKHSGLVSVQLQPPGVRETPPAAPGGPGGPSDQGGRPPNGSPSPSGAQNGQNRPPNGQNRPQNGQNRPPRAISAAPAARNDEIEDEEPLISISDFMEGLEALNRADVGPSEGAVGDYKARHLIRWYEHGGGAAKIAWGTPDDFYRCVALAGRHLRDPKGFCAERHHAVLGVWPGQEDGHHGHHH